MERWFYEQLGRMVAHAMWRRYGLLIKFVAAAALVAAALAGLSYIAGRRLTSGREEPRPPA